MIDFQIFQIGNQVIHGHKKYGHDYDLEIEDKSERILDSSRFLVTDNWQKYEAREITIDMWLLRSNGQSPLEVFTSLKNLMGMQVPIVSYIIRDCHDEGHECNCCFCNNDDCEIFWLESYGKLTSLSLKGEPNRSVLEISLTVLLFSPLKPLNPMLWEFVSTNGGYRNPHLLSLTLTDCDIPYSHPNCAGIENFCGGFIKYQPYNPLYMYDPEWFTKDWCLPYNPKFALDWQVSSGGYSIRVDRGIWNGASSFYVFGNLLDHTTDIEISLSTERLYGIDYFTSTFDYSAFLTILTNLGVSLTNDMILVIGDVKEYAFLTDFTNRYPVGSALTRTGGEYAGQLRSGMSRISVQSAFEWSMLHLFSTI